MIVDFGTLHLDMGRPTPYSSGWYFAYRLGLSSVSCPTNSFCAVLENESGYAIIAKS